MQTPVKLCPSGRQAEDATSPCCVKAPKILNAGVQSGSLGEATAIRDSHVEEVSSAVPIIRVATKGTIKNLQYVDRHEERLARPGLLIIAFIAALTLALLSADVERIGP
jgi:hypothetical protein